VDRIRAALPPEYVDHYRGEPWQVSWPKVAAALVALALVAAVCSAMAQAQDINRPAEPFPPTCFPLADVAKSLADKYGEEPVVQALNGNGGLVQIWASEGGATWTQILVSPGGMACIVGAGESIEVRKFGGPGEGGAGGGTPS
jgi:hypothetical protein